MRRLLSLFAACALAGCFADPPKVEGSSTGAASSTSSGGIAPQCQPVTDECGRCACDLALTECDDVMVCAPCLGSDACRMAVECVYKGGDDCCSMLDESEKANALACRTCAKMRCGDICNDEPLLNCD